jgi:hypothetical protein
MTKFSEWRIWNGGECPVAPDTLVQVQCACETRSASLVKPTYAADDYHWEWRNDGSGHDIIAYREVLEPVVTTLVQYWREGELATAFRHRADTHKIILAITDSNGEPHVDAVIERIVK